MQSISPESLRDKLDSREQFYLIDTRAKGDFEEWHIKDAINFPYVPSDELTDRHFNELREKYGINQDDQIITICAKGTSSSDFADELEKEGFTEVTVVEGGMQAWSGVYDVVPIATGQEGLEILQLQRRAKGCLGYIVGSTEMGMAAAFDVSRYVNKFIKAATQHGFQITRVFDTHIHADHISGGRELADRLNVPYHLSSAAQERTPQLEYTPVETHQVVEVGDFQVKAIPTPGHTSEMTSWLIEKEALISGDALFVDSIGRTELEFQEDGAKKGAALQYHSLLEKLLALPDRIKVLPGHFSLTEDGRAIDVTPGTPIFTSIGYLRKHNRALQMSEDQFVEFILDNLPAKPPNYEEVIALNLGERETASTEEAIELELGPNRCATSQESMVG